MRPLLLLVPVALAACGPSPGSGLAPLGPLLAAADALPREADFGPGLRARAGDLAARGAALGAPGAGAGGDAGRIADLEARAAALRAEGLSEAERERLLAGPSLP